MPQAMDEKCRELEARLRVLEDENARLAVRAEDVLLLGLVAESISGAETQQAVLENALERIAVLKDIPYCACCRLASGAVQVLESYAAFRADDAPDAQIILSPAMFQDLERGRAVIRQQADAADGPGVHLVGDDFVPATLAAIPFSTRSISQGVFVFAGDDRAADRLAPMLALLQRVVEMAAARLDNLSLVNDLQQLNAALNQKVFARTAALRESERRYRTLAEAARDFIFVIDRESRVQYVNQVGAAILGRQPRDVIGAPLASLFPARTFDTLWASLQQVFDTGEPFSAETSIEFPGQVVWLDTVLTPLGSNGEVQSVLGVSRDITARKRTEATWRALNAAAAALQRAGLSEASIYQLVGEQLTALGLRGIITRLDEATDSFVIEHIYAATGLIRALEKLIRLKGVGACFPRARVPACAQAVESGEAVFVATGPVQLLAKALPKTRNGQVDRIIKMLGPSNAILAPLRVEGRVAGLLHVDAAWLTEADLPAITAFAGQLSAALEHARWYEAERQRVAELTSLHEVGAAVAGELQLDDVLELVVRSVAELLEARDVSVCLLSRDGRTRTHAHCFGERAAFLRGKTEPGDAGLHGVVMTTGEPLLANDVAADPRTTRLGRELDCHRLLVAPLRARERIIGTLSVFGGPTSRAFTGHDLRLLSTFAGHAAIAIENARLFAAERQLRAQAQTLQELGSLIASSLDLDEVLNAIAHQVLALMDVPCCNIMLLEPPDDLVWRVVLGIPAEWAAIGRQKVGESLSGWVAAHRQPLAVCEMAEDERMAFRDLAQKYNLHSFLGAPMEVRGKLVGVLNVYTGEPRRFTPEEVNLMVAFAGQAAIAVENARLYEDIERDAESLRRRVAARTAALGERVAEVEQLNRAMANLLEDLQAANRNQAETTRQLQAANAELESFSYSVSHDLRAPLRAIDGFARILLEDFAPQLDPGAQRYLKIIGDNTRQMGQLIEDLLAFSRLGRQRLQKQPVAPDDLVRQALDALHAEQADRRVEVSTGDLPVCQADPALLKQVFVNLLDNALKFTRSRETAVIEIGSQLAGDERVYFVKDNGVGFDMRYASKLFGVFQRLHRAEDYEGTGVGLAILQRIIGRHGGRVWAEAAVDQGATFFFTLGEQ